MNRDLETLQKLNAAEKATILAEALPYIQKFHGKIVVVKYGGNAMINEELKKSVINDLILMQLVGMRPIIVHGGGPAISQMLQALNIQSHFVNGQRYTDAQVMKVVEMVLFGQLNLDIVTSINQGGGVATSISGADGNFLHCVPAAPELGFVGKVDKVNVPFMESILADDLLPVVSPIGVDDNGQRYNINADYAAGKIAEAMQAEKLVLLTDVEGLYADPEHKSKLISQLLVQDVPGLIESGIISGGMIPKVQCCVSAVAHGVKTTHILDGRKPHSILLEIFTKEGIGTMVTK